MIRLIEELRADPEFLSGIKRGLEARRKGQMVSWEKVKAELGIGRLGGTDQRASSNKGNQG